MQLAKIVAFVLIATLTVHGQAEAPIISSIDQIGLQLLETKAENVTLKIQLLQNELKIIAQQHSDKLKTLEKEGWRLNRDQNGIWSYAPIPKKP